MSKPSLLDRMLQTRASVYVCVALSLLGIANWLGYYGEYDYPHLSEQTVAKHLYVEVNPRLVQAALPPCDYKEVLKRRESITNWQVPTTINTFSAHGLTNGTYTPMECAARLSVALLVTYRNRQQHLNVFLPYMHDFLRKQNIHYKVYLLEQQDDKPWNKGLLYNTGARLAAQDGWPCLILHDVDLLPLDAGNLYACLQSPRHLSASIDTMRLTLPYRYLVGGALAIRTDQYQAVGGVSEQYTGWGGEDDDFYYRLKRHGYEILRLSPSVSHYTMLPHRQAERTRGHTLLDTNAPPPLPSHARSSYVLRPHPMFTLVGIHT